MTTTLVKNRKTLLTLSALMVVLGVLLVYLAQTATWTPEEYDAQFDAWCFAIFSISFGIFGLIEVGHAKYGTPQSMHVLRTIALVFAVFSFVGILGGLIRLVTG